MHVQSQETSLNHTHRISSALYRLSHEDAGMLDTISQSFKRLTSPTLRTTAKVGLKTGLGPGFVIYPHPRRAHSVSASLHGSHDVLRLVEEGHAIVADTARCQARSQPQLFAWLCVYISRNWSGLGHCLDLWTRAIPLSSMVAARPLLVYLPSIVARRLGRGTSGNSRSECEVM